MDQPTSVKAVLTMRVQSSGLLNREAILASYRFTESRLRLGLSYRSKIGHCTARPRTHFYHLVRDAPHRLADVMGNWRLSQQSICQSLRQHDHTSGRMGDRNCSPRRHSWILNGSCPSKKETYDPDSRSHQHTIEDSQADFGHSQDV
jgi:hypothetical protein